MDLLSPEFRPLTPALGAEVVGVDLREPLPDGVMAAIAAAWDRYAVLLFRNQELSLDRQRAFTEYFGRLQRVRNPAHPGADFMHIGNVEVNGIPGDLPNGEMWFHQDGCYTEFPMSKTFLYSLQLPKTGGNTKFASMSRVYEQLPAELQRRLPSFDIRFTYNYTAVARDASLKSVSEYVHPLVIAHPSTGQPLLYCNRLMAEEIVGLPHDESRALIEQLCDLLERPENVYEHVWQLNDFLMWDNLATAHARTDFDPSEPRLLRRTTAQGAKPRAFRDIA